MENKKVTFFIQMKQSVFDDIKEKAKQNPSAYNGNYLLSDLVFEFKDGRRMGGTISPLPLVYKITPESYNNGGNSGGGGSSSGGGNTSGRNSNSSNTNSGPGIDNTFTSNEYNTIGSDDIGWRQSDNGMWQYLGPDGGLKTGWLWDPTGIWYYIDSTGNMVTGWAQINNIWYLLRPNGTEWPQGGHLRRISGTISIRMGNQRELAGSKMQIISGIISRMTVLWPWKRQLRMDFK